MASLLQKITFLFVAIYIKLFVKLEVFGRENLNGLKPPLIVVANHKSYFDHWLLGYALMGGPGSPFIPLRFFTSDYFFNVWWTGWGVFLKATGAFRTHRGEGLEVSLKEPMDILKKGGTVIFYPEGGIVKNPDIGKPKRGIGALGFWSKERILPVSIKGSNDKNSGVKITFGQPFYIKDITKEPELRGDGNDYRDAANAVMDKVKGLFHNH